MSKKIFVAGPYNTHNVEVKQQRLLDITSYCVFLFKGGDSPISALLMGLSFAHVGDLPTDTQTWRTYSETLLKGCDELHVLTIEGWEESSGVQSEIAKAKSLDIPVIYV